MPLGMGKEIEGGEEGVQFLSLLIPFGVGIKLNNLNTRINCNTMITFPCCGYYIFIIITIFR